MTREQLVPKTKRTNSTVSVAPPSASQACSSDSLTFQGTEVLRQISGPLSQKSFLSLQTDLARPRHCLSKAGGAHTAPFGPVH